MRKIITVIILGAGNLHLLFIWVIFVSCLLYNFVNPPFTPMMLYKKAVKGYKKCYHQSITPSEEAKRYLVILEDSRFFEHHGFDLDGIKRAAKLNKRKGKIKAGGSTITQQTARIVFLTTHRNYFRKYLETIITPIMELTLSKNRILELYLNNAEWGKGVWGLEAASSYYYRMSSHQLTADQLKRLLAILSSPLKNSPQQVENKGFLRQRYQNLSY